MKVVKAKMSKLHNGRSLKNLDTSALMTALLMSTLWHVQVGKRIHCCHWRRPGGWQQLRHPRYLVQYTTSWNKNRLLNNHILVSKIKYCHVNQSFMYHCYLQENFGKFLSALNLNVKEKEKRESNLTLLLIVVLTQMIFCQVLTSPKRYVAACLLHDGASCSEMTTIKDKIQAMRQDMQCLFQIDKRIKIPTALYQKLSETFKCNICHRAPLLLPQWYLHGVPKQL